MLFTEPAFIFFLLPLLLGLYLVTPCRLRNLLLLIASLFFYWWGEKLFFLMVISIGMNYLFGLLVDRDRHPHQAKAWMIVGVIANLGLLGIYKYGNFAVDIVNDIIAWFGADPLPNKTRHLPIGISFFTFQAMSYVIDVYRGDARSQRNPLHLGLYVALFPQLIAGPIVRYHDVASQLLERHLAFADVAEGLQRFIIGLGKKMLLANAVGATAEIVFGLPIGQLSPAVGWLGIICYMLQLYFDFSGYSDMAIGLGRMFGFRFPENFNYPYISRSIAEMWQRWHITLGTWLRDYLYRPLGASRVAVWRIYTNLVLVFVLCGLWHGASWNFIIWGTWHGLFLLLERTPFGGWLKRIPTWASWSYTSMVWIGGLVLFKAGDPKIGGDLGKSWDYARHLVGLGIRGSATVPVSSLWNLELGLGLICGIIGSFPLVPWLRRRYEALRLDGTGQARPAVDRLWHYGRLAILVLILVVAVDLIASGAFNPFLYTQF